MTTPENANAVQPETVKALWKEALRVLQEAGVETPVADARLLVQHALDLTHEQLLMNGATPATAQDRDSLDAALKRRLAREPVSRIVGYRAFWKHDFLISPDTLDPRPDSETLIEAALAHQTSGSQHVIDLGTGSGCLLLSLLSEWKEARGEGIDISAGAVDISRQNAERLNLAGRAAFTVAGWDGWKPEKPADVLISNPPYISVSEKSGLAPEVASFDPPAALFAGEDGLEAYRAIIGRLGDFLRPGGLGLFEIGHKQKEAVSALLAKAGADVIETRQDLAGNDRVVVFKVL